MAPLAPRGVSDQSVPLLLEGEGALLVWAATTIVGFQGIAKVGGAGLGPANGEGHGGAFTVVSGASYPRLLLEA